MQKLGTHFKPYLLWLIVLAALVYGQVAATLALPDLMADIVNKGIIAVDSDVIVRTGVTMIVVTLLGGVATVGVGLVASRIATGFVRRLRSALFIHVEHFSLVEFNTFSTASLTTRATNDMQQLQRTLVMLLRVALAAPFMGVGAILKAYALAPDMSWIMALSIGGLMTVIVILFIVVVPKFKQIQTVLDRLGLVTREMLTGIRVIRAFNKESHEERRFGDANRASFDLSLFVNRAMVVLQPTLMFIMSLTSLAIIWIGARYVDVGTLEIGSLMAFMQYAIQSVMAFLMLSIVFIMAPRAWVSASRIGEVIAIEPVIQDPKQPIAIKPRGDAAVEFRDVSFSYENSEQPVLSHISFTAKSGETTAIIGGTGSGKSTIMNLIPRLFDVTGGAILIDGVDIRQATQANVRAQIGYSAQKATLFSGTIAENISYGSDLTMKEIKQAAKIAQAEEFIEKLTDGYKFKVARGGSNLSGGQKQRVSIARAIARKPTVYLFDDSFSALDFKTEATLRHHLESATEHKTVIIVGQRVSSIMNADQIIVIDNGGVAGKGTHGELMKSSAVYREIAQSQLSAEELVGSAS